MSTRPIKAAVGPAAVRARLAAALRWVRERQQLVVHELFDEDGLATVFQHARNVLSGTLIVAAGMYAAHHVGGSTLRGLWTLHIAGCVVTALGVVLLLLNLCDGLRRLARRRHHLVLRIATIVVYIALSVRLTQVIVHFRGGP